MAYLNIVVGLFVLFVSTDAQISCQRDCSKESYMPVCVKDSRGHLYMFSNECYFEDAACRNPLAGLKRVDIERCQGPPTYFTKPNLINEIEPIKEIVPVKIQCPLACTLELNPVCGQDQTGNLQTFGNPCHFEKTQCQDRAAGWKLLKIGNCDVKLQGRALRDVNGRDDSPIYCPLVCPLKTYPMCYRSC